MTISNDGFLHLWRLDNGLDELIAQGCERVRPYLLSDAGKGETRGQFCLDNEG
ncbi:MAG: hypothetical protein F6K11_37730 [Leptolyngbya sp. SIO3F4]|nr:hypothetical protein [Leptolyngbya sp. SIO3F4]